MFKLFRNKEEKLGIERNGIYLDFAGEEYRNYFFDDDTNGNTLNVICTPWIPLEDFLDMQTKEARKAFKQELEMDAIRKSDDYRKIILKRDEENNLYVRVNLTMSLA